jgi:hypothetical protein
LTDVHDTTVDIAELLETKESGAMGRVLEDIASCGVDWDSSRASSGINLGPRVELQCLKVLAKFLRHDEDKTTKGLVGST